MEFARINGIAIIYPDHNLTNWIKHMIASCKIVSESGKSSNHVIWSLPPATISRGEENYSLYTLKILIWNPQMMAENDTTPALYKSHICAWTWGIQYIHPFWWQHHAFVSDQWMEWLFSISNATASKYPLPISGSISGWISSWPHGDVNGMSLTPFAHQIVEW